MSKNVGSRFLGGLRLIILVSLAMILSVGSCSHKSTKETSEYNPTINPADFVSEIDNPYFPLTPGKVFVYEGVKEGANERNEVFVTHQTKEILGVTCRVVKDRVWVDTSLAEETYDWYAQDKEGNVWYFGEIALEYQNGVIVSTEGSWEAGVDDAKPGIVMEAHPKIGDTYRQEYLPDVAEDMAQVLGLTDSVTVDYGHFENCLKTKEWTRLSEGVVENKYYATGVGNIRTIMVQGGSDHSELVEIKTDSTF